MDFKNLLFLTPHLLIAILVVILMLQASFYRDARIAQLVTLTGLVVTGASLFVFMPTHSVLITDLIQLQPSSTFFNLLIIISSITCVLLQRPFAQGSTEAQDEYYILVTLATLGSLVLIAAHHAASFVLGLELMSLSLLAVIGYQRERELSLEATLKFLILSGCATAFLLFGLALLYAASGSLNLPNLLLSPNSHPDLMLLGKIGISLVLVGVGFKLSLIPFHWWTPDVYQGAPINSTLLLATLSKTAVFAILLRLLTYPEGELGATLVSILSLIAIISMIGGNLLALKQANLKRLFAYSAIAHMGYILVAAIIAIDMENSLAMEGSSYYLLAYVLASLAIFSALTLLSQGGHKTDIETIEQIRGLFWSRPGLASVLLLATLSMAGMPLTVGFIGKFYLLSAALELSAWWLISAMVVGSIVGIFYYLRVIFSLFEKTEVEFNPESKLQRTWVGVITLCLVLFGVLPDELGYQIAALFN